MNSTIKTILKIVGIVLAIAAVAAAVYGAVTLLKKKKKDAFPVDDEPAEEPVDELPDEFADFADLDEDGAA